MDLIILSEKLKEDPFSYKEEYLKELDALRAMIRLHNPPIKQIQPIIPFIVQHSGIAPEKASTILISTLEIRDTRLRSTVLSGLVIMRQKSLMTSRELFHMLLLYGSDLKPFHSACKNFLDADCLDILLEWYRKGTERQKCFCYYFILNFFSTSNSLYETIKPEHLQEVNDVICGALFSKGKLAKMCIMYFLNRIDIPFDVSRITDGVEHAKRLYKELQEEHFDRDMKILKLRVFVMLKVQFGVKLSVTKLVLQMMDLESEDLKELLECLVESVTKNEAFSVIQTISDEFMNERCADDVACYGMNVIREIYYKLSGLYKLKPIEEYEVSEEGEEEEVCEGSEVDEGSEEEEEYEDVSEEDDEEEKLDKEYKEFEEKKENKKFIEELKEIILNNIERYRGNKNKGIYYAYKTLLNAVLKNEVIARAVNYVRKTTTNEERAKMRKKTPEARSREIAQEKWKMKKSRKGKSKNRKNRLFEGRRKRVRRS